MILNNGLKCMENNAEIYNIIARIDEKKKKLDSFRPLPRELIKNLEEWFAVDYTYNSNAIEGNTLSLSETAIVVEKGITIGAKTIREHLEAISHMQSIDAIQSIVHRGKILPDDIIIFYEILPQKEKSLLAIKFIKQLSLTNHPIINAALCHLTFIMKNPFDDGLSGEVLTKSENGRTSRLLMNLLLLQTGYPFAIIKNEKRSAYIKAIEVARATNNCNDFCMIVAQAVEESIDIYLNAIKDSLL